MPPAQVLDALEAALAQQRAGACAAAAVVAVHHDAARRASRELAERAPRAAASGTSRAPVDPRALELGGLAHVEQQQLLAARARRRELGAAISRRAPRFALGAARRRSPRSRSAR